jgi:hypothetical protein
MTCGILRFVHDTRGEILLLTPFCELVTGWQN